MKRSLLLWLVVGLVGLAGAGCDLASDDEDTGGVVTLKGQVLNNTTNNPVPGAFVRVLPLDLLYEADSLGQYAFDVEIDSTMELRVSANKDGFGSSSTDVLALAGRTVNVPTLRLQQTSAEEPVSGKASNILLENQSSQSIGVRESGSREVATVTFQVADSLGRPVVLTKSADVHFRLAVAPGGGEFIHPASAVTDNNGKVTVNLSSGTKAGVVQIVAETNVDGRTIRSKPVSVAIHGGLPDQRHFSLGPARVNFPGLRTFGLTNAISVIVGDKFGNPVKPGTAVYFTTSHGVIEGSVLTSETGQGTVTLLSANPLPPDGVGIIRATTAGEQGVPADTVWSRTAVVFTGVPRVDVNPKVARLGQTYTLTVTDENGNPLAEGTTIGVRVEGTKVKAVGNTNVRLDDTAFIGGLGYDNILRGAGITEFTFRAVEDLSTDEAGEPTIETITITVAGPNGAIEIVLGAPGTTPRVRTPLQGFHTRVEERPDGSLRARLVE